LANRENEQVTLKSWPEQDRPREKLLAKGASYLTDAELLAIFLRIGIKGATALDIARSLLTKFGGLRGILESEEKEFCSQRGLGPSQYAQLQAVQELAQRHLLECLQRENALTSAALSRRYIKSKLRAYHREVFLCLFLDSQHRVIAQEELFEGSIESATVYPREVLSRAFYHNAAALIFAHNHPSGVAEPSEADIAITQRLKSALDLVDIKTLDHIVVGDGAVTSMAERGLL
jgi:DNA repair protein RadC